MKLSEVSDREVPSAVGHPFGEVSHLASLALVYLLSSALIFAALRLFFARDNRRESEPALAPV